MSSSPQSQRSDEFTSRSAHESICMTCYATIRAMRTENLEAAQQRHASDCSGWVDGEPRE